MTELDVLLEQLGKQGYLLHAFQVDQHGPDVLAAVRNHGVFADVVLLYDQDHACAWRVPIGPDVDMFDPPYVVWHYAHTPVWTLRALLTVAPPGHPEAPSTVVDPPSGYGLPRESRAPVQVKVPRWQH